jgi:putative N-acetyltransferase (TIGR04045 family)
MLDLQNVWGETPAPFLSSAVVAHVATESWQLDAYYRLRCAVFAEEQGIFQGSDVDEHDARATHIVAVAHIAGMADEVIGTVRIYETGDATWYGGRLGVTPRYRCRRAVGSALICAAVCTAHAWGCRRFLATIQLQNVRYFEQHHFRAVAPLDVRGRLHELMEADLDAYPADAAHAEKPVYSDVAAARFSRATAA